MFTGIILGLGHIESISHLGDGRRFSISSAFELDSPEVGESIAVNGVCLTATNITKRGFDVDVSPETLRRTTLGGLKVGHKVNLERALRLSDRLGGHIVTGHVDGVGEVLSRRELREFLEFEIKAPKDVMRYVIEKGSIAIDGISLTVNKVSKPSFGIAIIPHTASVTTMGGRRPGDKVNLEADVVGKYIEKLVSPWHGHAVERGGMDLGFLKKHGF